LELYCITRLSYISNIFKWYQTKMGSSGNIF